VSYNPDSLRLIDLCAVGIYHLRTITREMEAIIEQICDETDRESARVALGAFEDALRLARETVFDVVDKELGK